MPSFPFSFTATPQFLASVNPADYANLVENQTFSTAQSLDNSGGNTLYRNCIFGDHAGTGIQMRFVTDITFYQFRPEVGRNKRTHQRERGHHALHLRRVVLGSDQLGADE